MLKRYLLPIVAVLAIWMATVWGIGWQAQRTIEQGLVHFNNRVSTVLSSDLSRADAHVSIAHYQRGWLTSRVRYDVALTDRHGKVEHFILDDVLEHGPFPWSMLRDGQFRPVLAYSTARLQPTPGMQEWLAPEATTDTPLQVLSEIGFGGKGRSALSFAPLASPSEAGLEIAFSGGTVDLEVTDQFRVSRLQGHFDSYRQSDSQTEEIITLSDINIDAQTSQLAQENGLDHQSEMHIGELEVTQGDDIPALQLKGIQTSLATSQRGRLMDIGLQYYADHILINAADAGQLTLGMAVNRLDREALTELQTHWRDRAKHRPESGGNQTPESAQEDLAQAWRRVLFHEPEWRLDPLIWQNQAGQSHASAAVWLQDTFSDDATPDDWLLQSIRQADLEISLDRAMVIELFRQLADDASEDTGQGAELGAELFDTYADSLSRLGWVARTETGVQLAISVFPGENHVLLNDTEITLEQLMLLGMGLFLQF